MRTFVALAVLCLSAPAAINAQAETVITPLTKRAAPAPARQKTVPINDDGTDRNLSQPAAYDLAPAQPNYGSDYSVGSAMRTSRVQLGFELLGSASSY